MRYRTSRGNPREKGIALILTAMMICMIIPAVGLAVDASMLYIRKARLSAAVDAAALAAARSLNKGLTIEEQADSAELRARSFFTANFPNHALDTLDQTVSVQVAESSYRTRTVTVESSVLAPNYFMRYLNASSTEIRALGRASRRDVNLVLVLDRSGSMANSGSCDPMKAAARKFVTQFANNRDRLGLITYSTYYYPAYQPQTNFKTSSPSLDTVLSQITCTGGTGTAQALSEAYLWIKNIVNEPGALNLVVFFTDGLPNGIAANFPIRKKSDTRYGDGSSSYPNTGSTYSNMDPSTCKDAQGDMYDRNYNQSTAHYTYPNWNPNWSPVASIQGVIAAQGSGTLNTGGTYGLYRFSATSLNDDGLSIASGPNGCGFSSNSLRMRRDIPYIPDYDYYGNSTRGYTDVATYSSGQYSGQIRLDKPITIGAASKNAADNVAYTMRNDSSFKTVIYAIGLGDPSGGEPPDEQFMVRVSNDPTSPIYDPDLPAGLYVFAPDNTQLNLAFARVASEILRISF